MADTAGQRPAIIGCQETRLDRSANVLNSKYAILVAVRMAVLEDRRLQAIKALVRYVRVKIVLLVVPETGGLQGWTGRV